MKHRVEKVTVVDPELIDMLSGRIIFVGEGPLQNFLSLIPFYLASETAPELNALLDFRNHKKSDKFSPCFVFGWLKYEAASFINFQKFFQGRLPIQIQQNHDLSVCVIAFKLHREIEILALDSTTLHLVLLQKQFFHVPILQANNLAWERIPDSRWNYPENFQQRKFVIPFRGILVFVIRIGFFIHSFMIVLRRNLCHLIRRFLGQYRLENESSARSKC